MTYTFWHAGTLIGESALDQRTPHPRQRGGAFFPTTYGLTLFPILGGIFAAMLAFRRELEASGTHLEDLSPDDACDRMEQSPAGRRILDVGRLLSDVEVRAPDGEPLPFESMAFSEPREFARLAREHADLVPFEPPVPTDDTPLYLVSATFAGPLPSGPGGPPTRRMPWAGAH